MKRKNKSPSLIHIGTSGWSYSHWKDRFYPAYLASTQYLDHYSHYFSAVEINNSFYQLPEAKTFKQWQQQSPASFLFAVKASRYITHMKKLKDPRQSVRRFFNRIKYLENKLGPVLFQLPPRFKCNLKRLADFLHCLPARYRYVFEFRDPSWFCEEVYDLLRQYNAAFCIYELAGLQSPCIVTADFVYVRLHGPKAAYEGKYDKKALRRWAKMIAVWKKQKKRVFVFFDNDQNAYAVYDARVLQDIVAQLK